MKKSTYKIYTLGCKVNQYDSAKLKAKLKAAGFCDVKERAAWVIINTCAVTKVAIHKGKRMINKARNENPEAKIILMGCWPKAYPELIGKMDVDYVFKVNEGDKVLKLMKARIMSSHEQIISQTEKSRYFVKIQDGCEQFCSYCIIPYTRGKLKSRSEKEILAEIEVAIGLGYQEIVLSGIHLGLYGKEKGGTSLVTLIKKILKFDDLGRIRLSSIEIGEVSDDLIKLIAIENKFCKHLHIPLQAGVDKILKFMNRPYDTKKFLEKVKKIRKAIPDIAITTDVIVGFPGETKADFKETCSFIKKIKFSRLHVFSFSAHEKTPAFKMPNQVEKTEISSRSKILRKLNEKLVKNYRNKFKNKNFEVLIERKIGDRYIGKTEYYFEVEFKKEKFKRGVVNIGDIVNRVG